ncbi:MAG: hypothetical protein ABI162_03250 [Luteolibacter sp.]
MKAKTLFFGLSAVSFATSAYADVTVNITGSTAFRSATLDSIKAKYLAEPLATRSFKYAHDQTTSAKFNGATRAIFIGKFPGITGTTTIRCCFTGSVEGIKALAIPADPLATYYAPSLLSSTTATNTGAELLNQGTTTATNSPSQIAFSDVSKASTPYSGSSMTGTTPGIVVFTMMTNKGSSITNVTGQQFRALLTAGYQPLSMFTGNPNDTSNVFATGRNDGSGTRTTYLAETGYGITNAVKQYVTIASTTTDLTKIQLVPAGGVNTLNGQPATGQSASNASTIWGQDIAGNGGYNSGSVLRGDMAKAGASVTVLDETGIDIFGGTVRADLVTWVSVGDAVVAYNSGNGATYCAYNGVKLDQMAAGATSINASATDKAKVTNGLYTAWGYQNMYRRNDLTSDQLAVFNAINGAIPTNLGAAGIPFSEMAVFRSLDGGLVAP